MLDFAVDILKNLNYTEIYLWVLKENNRARRFYEKNGFHFNGKTREKEYGKPLVQLEYVLRCT
jgi:RimJ/RimL family protein N-acetyltransferase